MNINNRAQRRDRALNLFQAEAREQELAALAIRRASSEGAANPRLQEPLKGSERPAADLHLLSHATQANILQAHDQLQTARESAARMAAADPELARLNAEIDGLEPVPTNGQNYVIDADVVEVTPPSAESAPRLTGP